MENAVYSVNSNCKLQEPVAYLEPSWTSTMKEFFAKIVNGFESLFSQKRSIVDIPLVSKHASVLLHLMQIKTRVSWADIRTTNF